MLEPKWIGKFKGLKKSPIILLCLPLLGVLLISLSCNSSGTNSSSSSSAISGTGTNWTIEIKIGTNPLPFNGTLSGNTVITPGTNTTTVLALVRDRTGAPAPKGTNICTTAVLNGFLKPGSIDLFATICETTTNDLGQSIQTYQGRTSGVDTIEVSSQGVIARANLTVN